MGVKVLLGFAAFAVALVFVGAWHWAHDVLSPYIESIFGAGS